MLSSPKPQHIFLSAIALLLFSAAATAWTIYKLDQGERWVRHSFEVEITLGSLDSSLSTAGRARTMFVDSHDPKYLADFSAARATALADLAHVRALTSDNSEEQVRCGRMETAINRRLGALEEGIELAQSGRSDAASQAAITATVVEWAGQIASISHEMTQAENLLLQRRTAITVGFFRLIAAALAFTFLLAVFLIWEHYRRLENELQRRTLAEERAQNLSLQVLRVQDDERRRISRELHDGLGQNLTAAKMIVESLLHRYPEEPVKELSSILDESLNGARTMSYLLYPPLLEEIGLTSAAEWFIDGFSKRTGIDVSLAVQGLARRVAPVTELTLFRILQESLTNIQRHARSSRAEVFLNFSNGKIGLRIQDHGVGIPAEKLREFDRYGMRMGLGLTGMKNRVREQGGSFNLSSNVSGTTIDVQLPATTVA